MPDIFKPEHLDYNLENTGPGLAEILLVALGSAIVGCIAGSLGTLLFLSWRMGG